MEKSFGKMLKDYASFKESKCGSSVVTKDEVRALRKEFNESTAKPAGSDDLMKVVRQYATFKKSQTGSSRVTESEVKAIKAKLEESKVEAPKAPVSRMTESKDPEFAKTLKAFAEFKEAKTGSSEITMNERIALRSKYNEAKKAESEAAAKVENKSAKDMSFREAVQAFSKFKEGKTGDGRVTADEIKAIREKLESEKTVSTDVTAKLNEAKKFVRIGQRALKEGDMAMAQDMAGQAGDAMAGLDPNAAPAVGAPATPVDPTIAQQISDVKASVDALATAAGVGNPVDLGADAAAGIPAVEGQPAAGTDPAAPAATQTGLPESVQKIDLNALHEKIQARKQELEEKKAASVTANPYAVKDLTPSEVMKDRLDDANPSLEDNASQLAKVPSAKQISAGTDKDVVRWGKDSTTEMPAAVKKMGESEFDKYVFNNFDFNKLYEMTDGLVGRKRV